MSDRRRARCRSLNAESGERGVSAAADEARGRRNNCRCARFKTAKYAMALVISAGLIEAILPSTRERRLAGTMADRQADCEMVGGQSQIGKPIHQWQCYPRGLRMRMI